MKRFTALVTLILSMSIYATGQTGIDIALSPNMTFNSIYHGGTLYSSGAFDSIKGLHKTRYSLGLEVSIVHNINRDLAIQAGLRYSTTGFKKELKDLQFHDSIHPDIGRIEDLSTAASKDVIENFTVGYLEMPIRINYLVSPEAQLFKYGIYLSGGIIAQYRMTDYVNIRLTGFSVDGKTQFRKQESYIEYNNFNAGPVLGIRAVYRLTKDIWFMAKPELYIPLGDVANDDIRYRFYQFSGNIGLNITLD